MSSPGGILNALATALHGSIRTALSIHHLRLGLLGYLIPFAPLAFVSQCQCRPSRVLSPLVFFPISTHFTAPPEIPSAPTVLQLELADAYSPDSVIAYSPGKEVHDPWAFYLHAALLRQAFAHCGKFPTSASRRSLGRVSVLVWLIILSDQLLIIALLQNVSVYAPTYYLDIPRKMYSLMRLLRYLLMGGASSSILVHGFSWLYGSSGGEIELQEIVNGLINTQMYNSPGISIALIFIIVGIGFKLSPAPSHQWTPDVYEGVRDYECNRSIRQQKDHPKMIISWLLRTNQIRWFYFSIFLTCSYGTKVEKIEKNQSFTTTDEGFLEKLRIIVAFLSVTSKVAASASATQIFDIPFYFSSNEWHLLLEILAILSMILGNLIAITQTSMKRMLAYSSIGQIGYVIIGIIVGDSNGGYASMITYMLFYISMNLGTFACIVLFGLRTGTDNIRDYAGLYTKYPFLALSLALCLLSLGGLPPLADTRDSKSRAKERGGSSPLQGIILRMLIELE
ncbi:hypothetical protein V6N11_011997 [Hibiscus sabdariffa]|uniref:NADH:quinone oxidoreductase/Mrp antiporter transmembrane domain-containing protein n=1 Tax=Hibiscus sabdariffa TaxID=183260 RepID=A0ABR2PA39_9ROSI